MSGERGPAPDSGRRLHRRDAEAEVADEVAFHVEMRVRELVARGWSAEAARAEAVRRFGDIERVRRECTSLGRARDRRLGVAAVARDIVQDIGYAVRQLRAAPGFAAAAVAALALGIGGTTAIFGVVNAVVLRPYPFPEPARVVTVGERYRDAVAGSVSPGNFVTWRESSRSFTHMAALQWMSFNLAAADAPERVVGVQATHGFFEVFGVAPLLGRTFGPEEDRPGGAHVTVLSHGLWVERFGGDAAIVGRVIRLNGEPHTVIGVMPAGFDPYAEGERLWVPMALTAERVAVYDEHYLTVAARLAPRVTILQAEAELAPIAAALRRREPQQNADRFAAVVPFGDTVVSGATRTRLWILLGAVGLVLLIACGNVANLLLARGTARTREMSVRAALGAGRPRLVRQLLIESAVLSLVSGAAGTLLAYAGVRALIVAAPANVPRLGGASVDGVVLGFVLLLSCTSALLFGLVPALRAARHEPAAVLRAGGRGSTGTRDRMRGAFVAIEVALAFTLLAGAGLLIRSALLLGRADVGFDPAGIVSARVTLSPAASGDAEDDRRAFLRLADRLAAVPGVASIALSSQVPAGPGSTSNGLIPEGRPIADDQIILSRLRVITPDYFRTMGIPLVRGRAFDVNDIAGGTRVMIISRALAETAYPGADPIGKRMLCCEGSPDDLRWKTVVGVAGDVQWRGPGQDFSPEFYLPLTQTPEPAFRWIQNSMTIVARGGGDAAALVPAMRAAVAEVAPGTPVFDVQTMRERLRGTFAANRFNARLLGVLGAVGLLLSIVGVYGVVSYQAGRRTQEIGLRMALGASAAGVQALVTRQGLTPVLAGLILGAAGAVAATRLLRGSLFGVTATDPISFIGTAAVLLATSALAAYLPARRATRVDPGRVLAS